MTALLLVLDGLPIRAVGPMATPVLHGVAEAGGGAAEGGRAVMTTSTAPNVATFATGTTPGRHGITTGHVPSGVGLGVVDAAERGPSAPSLFEVLHDAGRSSALVVADRRLIGIMRAAGADVVRASDNGCHDGPERGLEAVIAADDATTATIAELLEDPPDLVVGHLRLPDAAAHVHGPDSREALDAYQATDRRLAAILHAAGSRWDDLVVAVVSDHDQEPVVVGLEPVDLQHQAELRSLPLRVVAEGGAALVIGPDRRDGQWLAEVPGVAGSLELGTEVRLVWARPGRVLGDADRPVPRSVHGGPGAVRQVAAVTGGHPALPRLQASLAHRAPAAADWAPTLAELLGVDMPSATGRSLL